MKPTPPERCRYCGRALDPEDPGHRQTWPFCCERCKMAELGVWFTDGYAIGRPLDEVADDASVTRRPASDPGGGDNSA